jgi:uncharacterized protein (DUF433 family)
LWPRRAIRKSITRPAWSFQISFKRKKQRFSVEGEAMDYKDIITVEPGKRGGKPCIRGMRITVYDVLDYLASGMNYQEFLADFPYLTQDDILACLKYAVERERYSP